MLNRKLNKTGLVSIILILSVLRSNAGITPAYLNDTSMTLKAGISSLVPEIPLHPSLENFVADYADDNDELFEKIKRTKSYYLKTIDKVFLQHNIPLELKYLAIVESKLNSKALSGCGAMGFWQFMPGTAKRFGLKITAKHDDRQNIWKSSVAAAKYLETLYGYFGDWLLVIAAYNSGPAPVLNAIKRSGSRNFWQLQYFLPKETRLHVKRFIATHYYFEGKGSLVTLGKLESEKYQEALAKSNQVAEKDNQENPFSENSLISQWVAVINNDENLILLLKK